MTNTLHAFEKQIGYQFQNATLLELALTHPSCGLENGDNQRLEFLGDAALGLIVAEALYENNPDFDEGALDHMRASLVNGKALAASARELDMGKFLQVSSAQRQHHPEPSSAMLEDAFEALIGAIHIDGGFDAARAFIHRIFGNAISAASEVCSTGNPKGRLQEWAQRQFDGAVPIYKDVSEEGPDHARIYTATVTLNDKELGRGRGSSKKAAESDAAKNALESQAN
jgi:ribonuclease III